MDINIEPRFLTRIGSRYVCNNDLLCQLGGVREDLIRKEDPVFVEVGVVQGNAPKYLARKFGGRIILYEASKETAEEFKFDKDGVSDGIPTTLHVKAITGTDGKATLYYYPNHPTASTLTKEVCQEISVDRWGEPQLYEVETISVETMLRENNLDFVDVLFLNCEGSEFTIFEELIEKPHVLDKFGQIITEMHDPYPNNLKEIEDKLKLDYPIPRPFHNLVRYLKWRS